MTDASGLVAAARQYLGVRFAHQGRSRHAGVDCLGLLLCVAEDVGLTLRNQDVRKYDRRDYGTFPDTLMLREQLEHALEPVDDMQVGDVALFCVQGRPQHLGLLSDYPAEGELGLIHAYAPMRKVVEHRLDAAWRACIMQVFRIPSGLERQRTTYIPSVSRP